MTKPIGRIWKNEKCLSGYIMIGQTCIKFAAPNEIGSPAWIFPAKTEEDKQEEMTMEETE